jgi:hypothetical protein
VVQSHPAAISPKASALCGNGILKQAVEQAAGRRVRGQVSADVGRSMGPIRSGSARGNRPHEDLRDFMLGPALLGLRSQVLDQCLVKNPVHRLAIA